MSSLNASSWSSSPDVTVPSRVALFSESDGENVPKRSANVTHIVTVIALFFHMPFFIIFYLSMYPSSTPPIQYNCYVYKYIPKRFTTRSFFQFYLYLHEIMSHRCLRKHLACLRLYLRHVPISRADMREVQPVHICSRGNLGGLPGR